MSVNIPNKIPAFTVFSFNLNGALSNPARKLKWVYENFVRNGKADLLLFQEPHFGSLTDVRKAFWPYRGELKGLSMNPQGNSRGVIAWVPSDSVLAGLVSTVTTDTEQGRWALMKISAKSEFIHILNIYAPSKSVAARESFFDSLKDRFTVYSNLIAAGDWNFVSRPIDNLNLNGPHPPDPHPKSEEWLEDLELIDTFAHELPDSVVTTFRHRNTALHCWKRLDRFYSHFTLLDSITHIDSISCPHISDHDPVLIRVGEVELPELEARVVFRMSRSLIKQLGIEGSKVHTYTVNTLATYANLVPSDPRDDNPNYRWDTCKGHLIAYYLECDKRRGQRLRDKKDRAVRLSKWGDYTDLPADLAQYTDAFAVRQAGELELKKMALRDYENARIRSRFNWIREGEHSSKLFFNSVKTAHSQTVLPNVKFNGIKSTCHSEKKDLTAQAFQETFSKRLPDPAALDAVLYAVRESGRGLSAAQSAELSKAMDLQHQDDSGQDGEQDWLEKLICGIEIYKAPGPDGIPNEFYYLLRKNGNLLSLLKESFKYSMLTGLLPFTMRRTYYRLLFKKGKFTPEQLRTGELDDSPDDPADLGNWRPIGLLCCDYKLFSSYM